VTAENAERSRDFCGGRAAVLIAKDPDGNAFGLGEA